MLAFSDGLWQTVLVSCCTVKNISFPNSFLPKKTPPEFSLSDPLLISPLAGGEGDLNHLSLFLMLTLFDLLPCQELNFLRTAPLPRGAGQRPEGWVTSATPLASNSLHFH